MESLKETILELILRLAAFFAVESLFMLGRSVLLVHPRVPSQSRGKKGECVRVSTIKNCVWRGTMKEQFNVRNKRTTIISGENLFTSSL